MWIFGFHLKEYVAVPGMLMLLLISMGVATFFVSLHGDAADSILILYLMEQEFGERRRTHQHTDRFNKIDNEVNGFYGSHPSTDRSSTRWYQQLNKVKTTWEYNYIDKYVFNLFYYTFKLFYFLKQSKNTLF